jgi:hypothetical protein
MNHIQKLTKDRDEARAQLAIVRQEIEELIYYCASPKFHTEKYAYVDTDLQPRLYALREKAAR